MCCSPPGHKESDTTERLNSNNNGDRSGRLRKYGSAGKECAHNTGDLGSIPGLGRSPGEGKGCPLQYSGLENSMDFIVYGVAKSWA